MITAGNSAATVMIIPPFLASRTTWALEETFLAVTSYICRAILLIILLLILPGWWWCSSSSSRCYTATCVCSLTTWWWISSWSHSSMHRRRFIFGQAGITSSSSTTWSLDRQWADRPRYDLVRRITYGSASRVFLFFFIIKSNVFSLSSPCHDLN